MKDEMIKVTVTESPVEFLIYLNECNVYVPESNNPDHDVVFSRSADGKLRINSMEVCGKMEALLIMYLQNRL